MGITRLNTFITGKVKDIFKTKLITEIGKTIAIDTNNWIYSPANDAMKLAVDKINVVNEEIDRDFFIAHVKRLTIEFSKTWLENGVKPIFVFDGKAPDDKDTTKKNRNSTKSDLNERVIDLKAEFQGLDTILVSPKKKLELSDLMKRQIWLRSNELIQIKTLLINLGIPVLQCTGEGEKLCSALVRHGIADAVFSTDTDNMIYGASLIVNKFNGMGRTEKGLAVPSFKTICTQEVLEGLEFTQEEFIDFCIMCGCDYNTNMPTISLGRAYKLMKTHGNIDNLPYRYDTTCLNHEKCRQLFKIDSYEELIEHGSTDIQKSMYLQEGTNMLEDINLGVYIPIFDMFYINLR